MFKLAYHLSMQFVDHGDVTVKWADLCDDLFADEIHFYSSCALKPTEYIRFAYYFSNK